MAGSLRFGELFGCTSISSLHFGSVMGLQVQSGGRPASSSPYGHRTGTMHNDLPLEAMNLHSQRTGEVEEIELPRDPSPPGAWLARRGFHAHVASLVGKCCGRRTQPPPEAMGTSPAGGPKQSPPVGCPLPVTHTPRAESSGKT